MLERLLITALLIGIGLAVYVAISRWQLHRAGLASGSLTTSQPGSYRILYFTTPTCSVCKTVQSPALQSLQSQFGGDLEVITVDSTEQPDLADRWQVMTVPTTFILDRNNTPRICNNGLANREKLIKQLAEIGLTMPSSSETLAAA
ncbi:MAG: thioredoxin family protein [Chloroflexota bacterium]